MFLYQYTQSKLISNLISVFLIDIYYQFFKIIDEAALNTFCIYYFSNVIYIHIY